MAPQPLPSNFIVNADGIPPLAPAWPELRSLARKLFDGELQGQENVEVRLLLMQWLAGGSTVALNCRFTPTGELDVRTNWFFADRCENLRLLAPSEVFKAASEINEDEALDAPLPAEADSPVMQRVAGWFRGLRK